MELDPSRWLISFAGFTYDWMITREWKKIFFTLSPVVLLVALVGTAWTGGQLDKSKLAAAYLELGDQEIGQWEQAFAPTAPGTATEPGDERDSPTTSTDSTPPDAGLSDNAKSSADSQGGSEDQFTLPKVELSRFAEVLFRRVQILEPSSRSQFVVGATLAQRGALDRAVKMLSKVAPDDRAGYPPAHAFLAMIYFNQVRMGLRSPIETESVILRHAVYASAWEFVPERVLGLASGLSFRSGKDDDGLKFLSRAAERNPQLNLALASRAAALGKDRYKDLALASAKSHAEQRLADNPNDDEARVMLAQAHLMSRSMENVDLAEKVLREGDYQNSPMISRALSDLYCRRFQDDLQDNSDGRRATADIALLDMAMRIDSTNPKVPEMIAALARRGGEKPSQEMVTMLQQFIVEGKATALTHLWLSEIYLLRKDFAKAVPHMQQVLLRMDKMPANLNNLAFVYAETQPEKLDEALQLVQRAIALTTNEPNANFFDTLGLVHIKLERYQEAIAAIETAIQLEPMRIDFQQRIREAHLALGNVEMAELHAQRVEFLKAERDKAAAQARAQAAASTSNESSPADAPATDSTTAEVTPTQADTPPSDAAAPTDAKPAGEAEEN